MEDTDGGNSGSLIHNQDEEAFSLLELRPSQISSHISISVDGRPLRISSPTLLGMLTQFGEWVEQIVLRERESNSDSNYTGMRELCIEFPDLGLWGYRPEADVMIYLMAPAAEVIRSSPSLSKLNLRYSHKLATIEVQALARALKESSSLRIIQIEGLEEGMAAVLLDAFPSEGSDLGKLILKGHQWEGSRVLISHILNANILHVEIFLGIYVQPEIGPPEFLNEPHTFPWEEIGRALLQVSILKKLSLDIWVPVGREQEDVDSRSSKWKTFLNGVKKMWEESQQSPLIDLSLFFSVQPNNRDQCLVSSVLLSLAGLKGVHLTVIPHLVSASDDTGIKRTANEVRRLNDEVFEVYAPVGDNPRVEVVFVHGVPEDESDPEPYLTTWSKNNQDPDKCWLNTWLTSENTEDLRLARILTVTYDCGVRKTDQSGNMDNFLVAENLTQSLITLARVGQHDCPVVLVGHCLGGLVIKEVCSEASRSVGADHRRATEFHNFLTNVKGLFFYSTPHLGWSRNFPSELQRADMMESLEVLSKYTSRVNHHFEQLRKKYHWRTRGVGESNKTRIFSPKDGESTTLTELVVEEASARGGSSEFSMVSDTDHFTICRPKSKESNSFLYLVEFIEYLLTETATKAP
ncbi:hypothetical protein R1sor_016592 [Riccia sorocarpa]|uniref:Uncharacterized protein n=1 Tax=Riccia sorocarpa TaxID=122646 RepID=A0ABD3HFU2_9MARC